jgi:hypothetical protein
LCFILGCMSRSQLLLPGQIPQAHRLPILATVFLH